MQQWYEVIWAWHFQTYNTDTAREKDCSMALAMYKIRTRSDNLGRSKIVYLNFRIISVPLRGNISGKKNIFIFRYLRRRDLTCNDF